MSDVNIKDGWVTGLGGKLLRKLSAQENGLPPLADSELSAEAIRRLQRPACVLREGEGK